MLVAPASRLFSTNSFTAAERSRITWPAQILCTTPLFIGFIVGESDGAAAASIETLNHRYEAVSELKSTGKMLDRRKSGKTLEIDLSDFAA